MNYKYKKTKSDFSVPLLEKSVQIFFHKPMTTFGKFFCGFGVHPIFQEQKFFIKMIYGWAFALKIFFLRLVHGRLFIRVVHWTIFVSAVSKCAGDTNGSDSVKPVGILNNFTLKCFHLSFYARTLKRHAHDNIANLIDDFGGHRIFFKNLPSYFWTDSIVSIMKFPVRYIVEKCREFYYKNIGTFTFADVFRHIPHTNDVPPIMPRSFTFQFLSYFIGNFFYSFFLFGIHMIKKFSSPKIKIWFEPMFFSGFFCGFERCGSAAFLNFRGGSSSPPVATTAVRTIFRILHHVGNCKFERFASLRSATNSYSILGVKTNSRFRILGEENFLIINPKTI